MTRLFQWLFAMLTVISMQSVYTKQVNINFELYFIILNSMILLFLIASRHIELKVPRSIMWMILISNVSFFIVTGFRIMTNIQQTNISANLQIVVLFTIYFDLVIVYFTNVKDSVLIFLKDTLSVIVLLAYISLFFYVFGQSFGLIRSTGTVQIEWGGRHQITSWWGMHFNPQGSSYKQFIHGRNTGIFSEAPQYAFLLCYGLLVELYIKSKVSIKNVFILIFTIFTTVSTTGAIIGIASVGFKFYLYRPKSKALQYVKTILLPFIFITTFWMIIDLYNEKATFGNSAMIRSNNNKIAWSNFLKSPLIGIGFKSDTIGVGGGNTSTVTQVLQEGGLLFLIFYFFPFVKNILLFYKRRTFNVSIFISMYFILLIPTVMTYTQFSVTVVAYLYSLSSYKKNEVDQFLLL